MLSAEGRNFFRLSDKSPKENEQIRQCGLQAAVVQWGGTKSPADCTVFTKLFGEFVTFQWADRVVGPYGEISMHSYPVGADDSVRPWDAPLFTGICGESVLPHKF